MTDREPLTDIVARLQLAMRPHAANPVTARSKVTDSPPPNGLAEGYGTRKNTMANTRNGGGSCHYKPRAADFANDITPATSKPDPTASVKPAGNRRVSGPATVRKNGRRMPSAGWERARATGENAAREQWATARHSLMVDAGDLTGPRWYPGDSDAYPSGFTKYGGMGRVQARYGNN